LFQYFLGEFCLFACQHQIKLPRYFLKLILRPLQSVIIILFFISVASQFVNSSAHCESSLVQNSRLAVMDSIFTFSAVRLLMIGNLVHVWFGLWTLSGCHMVDDQFNAKNWKQSMTIIDFWERCLSKGCWSRTEVEKSQVTFNQVCIVNHKHFF